MGGGGRGGGGGGGEREDGIGHCGIVCIFINTSAEGVAGPNVTDGGCFYVPVILFVLQFILSFFYEF